jgi:hypothetical protein
MSNTRAIRAVPWRKEIIDVKSCGVCFLTGGLSGTGARLSGNFVDDPRGCVWSSNPGSNRGI